MGFFIDEDAPQVSTVGAAPSGFFIDDAQAAPQVPSLFEHPIDALTSADWWLTRPSGERISAQQAVTGAPLAALNGLTFGLGDEIVAGGGAAIDAVTGGPGYDARLLEARQIQDQTPTGVQLAMGLAGGLKMPISSGVSAQKSLLQNAGTLAKEGALYGGAYGFGAGEGGFSNRIVNAGQNAAVGAVAAPVVGVPLLAAEKAVGAIGEKAPEWAQKYFAQAMGGKPNDFTKSARQAGVYSSGDDTVVRLQSAFKQLEQEGMLKGDISPEALWNRAAEKSREIGDELSSVLDVADNALAAQGRKVIPQFPNAEKYIKGARADYADDLISRLSKFKKDITAKGDGTLKYIQNQKEQIYATAYPEGAKIVEDLDKAIARDLKQMIESWSGRVLPKDKMGVVRNLNRRLGAFEEVSPILAREVGKVSGKTPTLDIRNMIRTSGGYGAPTIVGGIIGGGPGAALGAAAGAAHHFSTTPTGGKVIGNLLNKASGARLPEISSLVPLLTGVPALAAQPPEQAKQKPAPSDYGKRKTNRIDTQPLQQASTLNLGSDQLGIQRAQIQQAQGYQSGNNSSLNNRPNPAATQAQNGGAVQDISFIKQLPSLVQAVIGVESRGNPRAVSEAGALGLMQLMPENIKTFGVADPFDPLQNVEAGRMLLAEELDRYKDEKLALAAYNAGSPKVNRAIQAAGSRDWAVVQRYLPKETRDYVSKVFREQYLIESATA